MTLHTCNFCAAIASIAVVLLVFQKQKQCLIGGKILSVTQITLHKKPFTTRKISLHTFCKWQILDKPLILFSLCRRHCLLLLQVLDHSVLFHHHLKQTRMQDDVRTNHI